MSEFLLQLSFLAEVSAVNTAGTQLNSDYAALDSSGVSTLQTSMNYIRQHEQIKRLIEGYMALIEKDTKDMVAMQQEAEQMDFKLAGTLTAL